MAGTGVTTGVPGGTWMRSVWPFYAAGLVVLLLLAAGARLLVVGGHGQGAVRGLLMGSVALHCVLAGLAYPYVEAHDDSTDRPERCLPAGLGQRVAIVRGYCAQSYLLGLEIALEHLGCSELDDVHVGT